MLFVVITGLFLLFTITSAWYVSQAVVVALASFVLGLVTGSSSAEGVLSLSVFCSIIWGPVLDIMVVVWMVASAQQRDVESELYG